MSDFKWGIIGPGRIAQRFAAALHAECVGQLGAVASRNRQRASEFAEQYGAAKTYYHYDDLIADPALDAIYIATPHAFHFELAKQCLVAGKPVLCEKPLTVNAQQCEALINIAKQHNTFLMEAMWSPFLPIYQQVQQWQSDGQIGELKCLHSTFGFNMPRNVNDRWLNPDLAGGVLLDMGVYNVAISQWLMGQAPERIQALGLIGDTGVDELVTANLAYSGQRYAQFMCNFHAQTDNSFWINGSEGRICIEGNFWDTTKAKLIVGDRIEVAEKPFDQTGFEYEIAEVESCVCKGTIESRVISHDFTLDCARTMDAILEQCRL